MGKYATDLHQQDPLDRIREENTLLAIAERWALFLDRSRSEIEKSVADKGRRNKELDTEIREQQGDLDRLMQVKKIISRTTMPSVDELQENKKAIGAAQEKIKILNSQKQHVERETQKETLKKYEAWLSDVTWDFAGTEIAPAEEDTGAKFAKLRGGALLKLVHRFPGSADWDDLNPVPELLPLLESDIYAEKDFWENMRKRIEKDAGEKAKLPGGGGVSSTTGDESNQQLPVEVQLRAHVESKYLGLRAIKNPFYLTQMGMASMDALRNDKAFTVTRHMDTTLEKQINGAYDGPMIYFEAAVSLDSVFAGPAYMGQAWWRIQTDSGTLKHFDRKMDVKLSLERASFAIQKEVQTRDFLIAISAPPKERGSSTSALIDTAEQQQAPSPGQEALKRRQQVARAYLDI